jgi:serine/threonine protein kinase/Tol biopolymer transport system component
MTPERWQRIKKLYHSALERDTGEQAVFLAEACDGDEALRGEVESLLHCDTRAERFIESPALEVAAKLCAEDRVQSMAGRQIGPYQILSLLGAGGMGEVYLALDARLGRRVAVKFLLAEFTTDAERLRRFEQEARAASALNHPNIITVYEIGEIEGRRFIGAEYVEGETLRQRMASAPQRLIKLSEALEIAAQIAAALQAAHEAGIIHRDIKPENVMLRDDGLVKVLDFGLAKLSGAQGGSQAPAAENLNTRSGTVMGTASYMSPEQARGGKVDHRTDIFSLGVTLYEMLAGRRPFEGATASDVMAAVLTSEPISLAEVVPMVPVTIWRIVQRCLEKKSERRFQTASDLGFALEALSLPGSSGANRTEMSLGPDASARSKRSGWRERSAWIVANALALALLAFGIGYFRRQAPEAEPMRFFVTPPEKAARVELPAISPDGRTLAFVAFVEGKEQLLVRPLNSMTFRLLAEVRNVFSLFWSPDSLFIGFIEGNKLKKIPLAGGAPEVLCDSVDRLRGGAWNREGVILLGAGTYGIRRVSANGGDLTAVTTVDSLRGETGHVAPVFLPDGRHFIFYKVTSDPARRGAYLASLDGGEPNLLLPLENPIVGVAANPAAWGEGYLVFARQESLLAQRFDLSRNQLMGEPLRLAQQVKFIASGDGFINVVQASLSADGVLVLIDGSANQQLTWFDRTGKKLDTVGPVGNYFSPRLSRDDQHLAVGRRDLQSQNYDIHLFDLTLTTWQRFTFDPGIDETPIWSPDGSHIVWTSHREGVGNLYQKAASGAGPEELLLKSDFRKRAMDWSADGRFILYREINPQTNADLWVVPLEGESTPWQWLNTRFSEPVGKFSPDGKWIAYQSNESGRSEIFLRGFAPRAPASGGIWQLSTNGGEVPQWRRDGRELYYLSTDKNKLMAVEMTLGAEVKYATPKELFSLSDIRANRETGYARTGDGQRFLFVTSAEEISLTPFTVALNWMAEVKK